MRKWKTIHRRRVVDFGRFLAVEAHRVELPDSRVVDDWPWIEAPDYAVVLASSAEGRFLVFRQTRYAIEGTTLALSGGYLQPDEDAETAIRRELHEEAGCKAGAWIPLGSYRVDSNRGAGRAHLFVALDVRPVAEPVSDDLEETELLWMDRRELEQALDRGDFKCLAWAALVGLGLRYLDQHAPPP